MTEEVIKALPEALQKQICTLKKVSEINTNGEMMCESKIKVVYLGEIPKQYIQERGWRGEPKSNAALYGDTKGMWYFIEFQNGKVHREDIYRKIYDSLILLMELKVFPDFDFIRKQVNYILVYQGDKTKKIQESMAREEIYHYMRGLANQEKKLFGVDRLEGYLLQEAHTYTKSLFYKSFVHPMEQEEGLYEG
ncbi:MAG: hypothetical protein IKM28_08235 [Lachnospiraceae bacterium]|nr:hypothetical protein [Lachnospiraceae bacterium]